jgi:thiazole synthase
LEFLQIIIQQLKIPVIVDAGIRSPSDVVKAFEIGAHGVLLNTALALSQNTELMAEAFAMAAACGRKAFLAGLMEKSGRANPSSLTHFLD